MVLSLNWSHWMLCWFPADLTTLYGSSYLSCKVTASFSYTVEIAVRDSCRDRRSQCLSQSLGSIVACKRECTSGSLESKTRQSRSHCSWRQLSAPHWWSMPHWWSIWKTFKQIKGRLFVSCANVDSAGMTDWVSHALAGISVRVSGLNFQAVVRGGSPLYAPRHWGSRRTGSWQHMKPKAVSMISTSTSRL